MLTPPFVIRHLGEASATPVPNQLSEGGGAAVAARRGLLPGWGNRLAVKVSHESPRERSVIERNERYDGPLWPPGER